MSEITDYDVSQAMQQRGGSFVKLLGRAFQVADSDNQRRIKETWPEYWEEYIKVAKWLKWLKSEPKDTP